MLCEHCQLKIKLGQPGHCTNPADVLRVELLVMTDIMCPAVLTVWRSCRILNFLSSGKSVHVVLVSEGSSGGILFSIKQLSYLEATVLFFVEGETRQSVASTLYIICIILLTLYTLLVLIQTLMHTSDTSLER